MATTNIWSWRQAILQTELASTTKLVLLTLSTYMNDHGGGAYPSVETLCANASLSKRSMFDHLKIAEDAGWLRRQKRRLKGSDWAANEYFAAWPAGKIAPVEGAESREVRQMHPTEENDLRGAGAAPLGCACCLNGVHQMHTNSPMNSPENILGDARAAFGKLAARLQDIIAAPTPLGMQRVHAWLAAGADAELDIIPTVQLVMEQMKLKDPMWRPTGIKFFEFRVLQAAKDRKEVLTLPNASPAATAWNTPAGQAQTKQTTQEAYNAIFGND